LQASAAERAEKLLGEIAGLRARLAELDLTLVEERLAEVEERRTAAEARRTRRLGRNGTDLLASAPVGRLRARAPALDPPPRLQVVP